MNKEIVKDIMSPNDSVINKYNEFYNKINKDFNEVNVENELKLVNETIICCSKDSLIKPDKLELISLANNIDTVDNCKKEKEELDKILQEADDLKRRIDEKNAEIIKQNTLNDSEYNQKLQEYNDIKNTVSVLSKYKQQILFLITLFKININFDFKISDIDKTSLKNKVSKLENVFKYTPSNIVNTIGFELSLVLLLVICLSPISDIILLVFIISSVIIILKGKSLVTSNTDIIYALFANESNAELIKNNIPLLDEESEEFIDETNAIEKKLQEHKTYESFSSVNVDDINNNYEEYEEEVNRLYNDYVTKVDDIQSKLSTLKTNMEEFIHKFIEEHKYLVDYCNSTIVMDESLKVGRTGIAEASINIDGKNIIINETSDNLVNALLPAFMSSVLPGNAIFHIVDPNDMGVSVADYYDDEFKDFFLFENKGLDEVFKEAKTIMQDNIKMSKSLTVQNFNMNAQTQNSKGIIYNVYFILSQGNKALEKEEVRALLESSVNQGVIIVWKTSDIPQNIDRNKVLVLSSKDFSNVELYNFNTEDRVKFINNLKKTKKEAVAGALLWGKEFIWRICKPEEEWTFKTEKGIDIYPGFLLGDPTKAIPLTIGDANVHALAAGTTGAGKSVFLNHLIGTLGRQYSPLELELWLCDFKGSEFVSYIPSERYPHGLPHIKCCLCTSDGAYASSVMDALRVETNRRYAQLMDYNISNFKNWNKFCDQQAQVDTTQDWVKKKWPRILMIADEFQNMFQSADDDQVQVIQKALTYVAKIGRQSGVHMLFASQSLTGTLSSDVLNQFSMRFCLRATADTSEQLIGCDYAANMPAKMGWVYCKDSSMYRPEQLELMKTPWINDDEVMEDPEDSSKKISEKLLNVRYLAQKAEVMNIPKKEEVITYIEKTKHPIKELDDIYARIQDELSKETSIIVFGERMAYNPKNPGPLNRRIMNIAGENIFSQFANQIDYIEFVKQILYCLQKSGVNNIIVSSQDKDMEYLCEIDRNENITKKFGLEIEPKKILDAVENNIKKREESGDRSQMWVVLLGWNKAEGVGINTDYEITDRMYNINMKGPALGIHMLYVCNSDSKINDKIINSCNIRVAGKVSEDASYKLIDKKWAARDFEGIQDGYMYIRIMETITRCKIYQSPQSDRKVFSSELVL